MKKSRIPKNDNPFVRGLLGYVDIQDVNLTALSLKARLSSGSLGISSGDSLVLGSRVCAQAQAINDIPKEKKT
jgi:hypothetical protein